MPLHGLVQDWTLAELIDGHDAQQLATAILPTVLEMGHWRGELRLQHLQTGDLIPMELNVFAIFDRHGGNPAAVATIGRDITERKRTERLIKASEERYRVTLDSMADAMAEALGVHAVSVSNWERGEPAGRPRSRAR